MINSILHAIKNVISSTITIILLYLQLLSAYSYSLTATLFTATLHRATLVYFLNSFSIYRTLSTLHTAALITASAVTLFTANLLTFTIYLQLLCLQLYLQLLYLQLLYMQLLSLGHSTYSYCKSL